LGSLFQKFNYVYPFEVNGWPSRTLQNYSMKLATTSNPNLRSGRKAEPEDNFTNGKGEKKTEAVQNVSDNSTAIYKV
jgi:hypothetical protein